MGQTLYTGWIISKSNKHQSSSKMYKNSDSNVSVFNVNHTNGKLEKYTVEVLHSEEDLIQYRFRIGPRGT